MAASEARHPTEGSDWTLRNLRPEDYDELLDLWTAADLPFRPLGRDAREHITHELGGPCSVFLGAEADDRLLGAVLGTHDGRKGWINRLAVRPECQLRGIGASLIAALEMRFRSLGLDVIACLIEDWNGRSQEVFERLGYQAHHDITYFTKRSSDTA